MEHYNGRCPAPGPEDVEVRLRGVIEAAVQAPTFDAAMGIILDALESGK